MTCGLVDRKMMTSAFVEEAASEKEIGLHKQSIQIRVMYL